MLKQLFSRDPDYYHSLLKLTLPIAIQNLMLASVAAGDALMLGSLSQNAMSAVSLATQIQAVQNMILSSVTGAATILGAQYWGRGDKLTLRKIVALAMKFNLAVSLLTFLGCFFCPNFLMSIFTDVPELREIGVRYLAIASFSYLLTGISQSYLTLLKITDHAAMTATVSTVSVLLNIGLNAVFIFGLCGAPAMGAEGAALATLLSRIVEFFWSTGISFKKGYITIHIGDFLTHSSILLKDFLRCMLPLAGACLFWGIGFTAYSAFMGHLGTDAAAANSVAAVVRDLVCCLCNGLASGGGILVGNELGAGKLDKGKLYGDRTMIIGFICGGVSAILMLLATPLLMAFVNLTGEARRLLWGMMLIMAFYMIGRAVNTIIINGIFAAGGDTLFDVYSLAVTMWGLAIPLAVLGTFFLHWPVLVVYACTCLDEVGKIPWVMIHYRKYKWVKDLTRSKNEI